MAPLACVLYLSIENESFNETSLHQLVYKAQEENKNHGVTGFLYYKQNHFFQYVEGNQLDVNNLLNSLKKDTRHKILECIYDDQLHTRRFPNWNMGDLKTNQLMQIKFEDLIIENLLYRKVRNNSPIAIENHNLWKLIDNLAFFQNSDLQ
ncbi:BLUF domain-containing protein [Aquimarina sp. 433]